MPDISAIQNTPDVSFIDNKTIDDVRGDMVADFEAFMLQATGSKVSLGRASVHRMILYSAAVQIYQAMQYVDRAGKQSLLKYSYSEFLDNLALLKGVTREPAKAATTTIRFTASATRTLATPIPAGTRVSSSGSIYFSTMEYAEIPAGSLTVDVLARRSRFLTVNPGLKLWCCAALLALCLLARTPWPPLALFFAASALTAAGGVRPRAYLSLLGAPATFLLLSGIALLWEYASAPGGVANVPFLGGYFVLRAPAQTAARLVMARALGAVGCLYFLSLSTPVPELLDALRCARVPEVVGDLAVLIYRYIFILFATFRSMRDAAASRLGYAGPVRSLRTTGRVYGGLLAHSFRRAQACFDAMESRCYDGGIRFLTREKPVRAPHALVCGALTAGMVLALVCGA